MKKALDGLRVLDLSRVLAGPYCTMILADLGAEVIKIEPPGEGDDSRAFAPFIGNESAYFMSLNRGKKSIVLNLKNEKDKAAFLELVRIADVLVENYRPGTMEKLGLGYEALREINPRLVYAAISGFGHTGPYSQRPAYDMIVQAMGGIMSITGEPNRPPTRVGTSVGDITAALFGTIGIMTALTVRHASGKGQKVDVGMLDCQVAILENAIARYEVTGQAPKPMGSRHPSIAPFEAYPTKDYFVIIPAGNDALWGKLCNILGITQFIDDPRFKTNRDRVANVDVLYDLLGEVTKTRTTAEWMEILETGGVPVGPINTIDKVVADPQVLAREMIVEINHPVAGPMKIAGNPIKLSDTPGKVSEPAPLLGQHTDWVLRDVLGWDDKRIAAYKSE